MARTKKKMIKKKPKVKKRTTKNTKEARKKPVKKKISKGKVVKKRIIKAKRIPFMEYELRKYAKEEEKKFSHKPFVAAILNFFLWGAGFIYVGRAIYGILWLFVGAFLVVPSIRMQQFLPPRIALYFSMGYLLISTLLAVDAYFDAIEVEKWG